jgi:hypothetical protein
MLRKKIILRSVLGAFALLLILLAAILLLGSWIINRPSVKERIEAAASRALGGQVTYERARLSLLLHPHVAIHGLRLSIPGALSGRAAALDLYAELRPLLTGTVRLTGVTLDHPDLTLAQSDRAKRQDEPKQSTEGVIAALGTVALRMPGLTIAIDQGRLTVTGQEQPIAALREINARLALLPEPAHEQAPAGESFTITGDVRGALTDIQKLPGPVTVAIKRFEARPRTLSFTDATAQMLDTSFAVSGTLDNYLTTLHAADITLSGTVGPGMMQWVRTLASLPPEMTIHTPITLSRGRLDWHNDGTVGLEVAASLQNGLTLSVDLLRTPDRFSVKALRIRDADSQAAMTLTRTKNRVDLTFSGHLSQSTLNGLFDQERFRFGWFRGDISAAIALDHALDSTVRGRLEGERLVPPFALNVPVIINRISLTGTGRTIALDPLVVTLGEKMHTVKGDITAATDEWRADLKTDGLEWEPLHQLFTPTPEEPSTAPAAPKKPSAPLQATVRIETDYLTAGAWTARPVRAEITIKPERTHVRVDEAGLCGMQLTGTATVRPAEMELALNADAKRQSLAPSLNCLFGKEIRVDGAYDFSGAFTSRGEKGSLVDNLQGPVSFTASDGRINYAPTLVRILEYLNTTELLKGKLLDPRKSGLPYQSFALRGNLKSRALTVDELIFVSPTVDITGRGSLNLADRTINAVFLVAPFPTADAVVKNIPLLKDILHNTLVTIPVRVRGPHNNPTVTALPPDQVTDEMGGMMTRTLKLPFTMIKPILPKQKPEAGRPDR